MSTRAEGDAIALGFHAQASPDRPALRRSAILFAALFAAGAAVRLFFLDRQSLWFDEGVGLIFSTCGSIVGCLDSMLDTPSSERFQFVYPLLLHEWRLLFGSSEIALRSLSVACNLAATVFVWLTAKRAFGSAHAAWSLAFSAVSAFTVVHAQEARPYTFFMLIAAVQLWLLLRARNGFRGSTIAFHIVAGLASWAGLFPLLFSVALALADLVDRRVRFAEIKAWLVWWLPSGLLSVPAVAYYVVAAANLLPSQSTVPKSDMPLLNLAFVLYGLVVGQTYGPPVEELRGPERLSALLGSAHWLALLAAILALGAVQAFLLFRRQASTPQRSDTRLLIHVVAAYLALSFLFAVLTGHNWLPRHAVALHPPLALLLPLLAAAPGIARFLPSGRATIVGLLLLNVVSISHHYFDRAHWKDDYRGAVAYLEQIGEPQRPVLVLRGLPILFDYYGYDRLTVATDPPRQQVAQIVRSAAAGRPEIVIVLNRESDLWPADWLEAALRAEFRLIATKRLPYFSIYTYARR